MSSVSLNKEVTRIGTNENFSKKEENYKNFFNAAKSGNAAEVAHLMRSGSVSLNSSMILSKGHTPLMLAAAEGNKDVVVELLKDEKIVGILNLPNPEGKTALYLAAEAGHTDVVKELLSHKKVEPQETYNDNVVVLFTIPAHINGINFSSNEEREKAQEEHGSFLIQSTIKVRRMFDSSEKPLTPFLVACKNGHVDIVQEFMKLDAIKNDSNTLKEAVKLASKNNKNEILSILPKTEVTSASSTTDLSKALSLAAEDGNLPEIYKLLGLGEIETHDHPNRTSIIMMTQNNMMSDVYYYIDNESPAPDFSQTALCVATAYGHNTTVKELLSREDLKKDERALKAALAIVSLKQENLSADYDSDDEENHAYMTTAFGEIKAEIEKALKNLV